MAINEGASYVIPKSTRAKIPVRKRQGVRFDYAFFQFGR